MQKIRIQKLIATTGLYSRRQADELVKNERVKVNGKPIETGTKISPCDHIEIDDKPLKIKINRPQMLALNKPVGYICSRKDPSHKNTVFDLLPEIKNARWISIGRLDINTSGLLLFTTDGELANKLMHPSSNINREYLCRVYGVVKKQQTDKLLSGIDLHDGKPPAVFKSIVQMPNKGKNTWFKVVITEGRNREIRRMWQSVDCKISRLIRIGFADVKLPDTLASGKYSSLSDKQIEKLMINH